MAVGAGTVNDIGGAVSDLFSSEATASGLRLKAQGDLVEGQNYTDAATLAQQNEQFTEQSTAVKQLMSDRQIAMGLGTESADIAGAGFSNSGSALDLMRSSAQQGALQKALVGEQGLITEAGQEEQAKSYTNLAGFAQYSAQVQNQEANTAEKDGEISAGIKGVAAIASLFTGGAGPSFSGDDSEGYSEDAGSLSQSSRGGGYGGGAFG